MKGINRGRFTISLFIITLLFSMLSCANGQQQSDNNETSHKYTNLLIEESSPYLLQHAHNPVNWYPWGDQAFDKAKKEDKLVLISVGYSSCHWCHVMEEESFEDTTIAKFMNENFVCIKVDREERPDVDQIYMTAVQLMTGSGGWPLNCFALPDGRPVYGGTYFPSNDWMELLQNLALTYKKDKNSFEEYATNLTKGIKESELIEGVKTEGKVDMTVLDRMVENWQSSFDKKLGGPDRAPKFPIPNNYRFLMQYAYENNHDELMTYVDLTLEKMALGGIFDQIGGGFARYSTDSKWKVPHFEKMLYDNAQLISLYSLAYQRTKKPLYKSIVYKTIDWLEREMMTPKGAFWSALDADSEGKEGKFYVWTAEEVKSALTDEEFELAKAYYNLNLKGKWEGKYILLRDDDFDSKGFGLDEEGLVKSIKNIDTKLLQARSKRIRPRTDDKILTGWNAMMISALSEAAMVFDEERFKKMAIKNSNWVVKNQFKKDGGLWHTHKDGKSKIDGFLDDYAFTITGFTKLYELTFDESWLVKARDLIEYVNAHFYDQNSGMYYYTSSSSQALIARKMEVNDNVIPSSNSEMANALYQIGTLLDSNTYKTSAENMFLNIQDDMTSYPTSFSNWGLLAFKLGIPYYEIAITGKEWENKVQELNQQYIPNKLLMGGEKGNIPLLEGKFIGETTIFVCVNKSCKMPVVEVSEALKQMEE